jgi:serine protease Do
MIGREIVLGGKMKQHISRKPFVGTSVTIAALVMALAVACGAAPAGTKGKSKTRSGAVLNPTTYDPQISLAPLVEKVSPAVVNIRTTVQANPMHGMFGPGDLFQWFFGPGPRRPNRPPTPGPQQQQRSVGSGFIISADGLVVTNHHVVIGAEEIEVQIADDRTFKAELVGSDQRTDVALLRLHNAKGLPVVRFGNSDKLRVGDHVVAIGNPFGLDHTVTSGIVSAKERVIGAGPYDDFIQTDASINPGNSGGPLFNLSGEVIGINTAINPQGQGIGFAIPSSLASKVIDALNNGGQVVRGWLGIGFQPLNEELAKAFGVSDKDGAVVVSSVNRDSPADKGGMKSGDIIVSVNGKKLTKAKQLPSVVANLKPGTMATVNVIREGKARKLKIKIGQLPSETDGKKARPAMSEGKTKLGLRVQELDDQTRKQLDANEVEGVVVTQINPDSPARGVLSPGDIIVEINRERVRDMKAFAAQTKKLRSGDDLLLHIYRRGGWRYVVIRL